MRGASAPARVSREKVEREALNLDRRPAIRLEPWQEVSGVVERLRRIEGGIEIAIRGEGVLALTGLGEREARRISAVSTGTRVSILRTDLPHRPYVLWTHSPTRGKAAAAHRRSSP